MDTLSLSSVHISFIYECWNAHYNCRHHKHQPIRRAEHKTLLLIVPTVNESGRVRKKQKVLYFHRKSDSKCSTSWFVNTLQELLTVHEEDDECLQTMLCCSCELSCRNLTETPKQRDISLRNDSPSLLISSRRCKQMFDRCCGTNSCKKVQVSPRPVVKKKKCFQRPTLSEHPAEKHWIISTWIQDLHTLRGN